MKASLHFLLLTICLFELSGCQTTSKKPTVPGLEQSQKDDPFRVRGSYPEALGVLIQKVFATHQFLRPPIVASSSDSSIWFVAERDKETLRFDRLYVYIDSKNNVIANITPYQFVGSDWAELGPLVANPKPEAESVANEISSSLKESRIKLK